jgi:hypothetical protein
MNDELTPTTLQNENGAAKPAAPFCFPRMVWDSQQSLLVIHHSEFIIHH